MVYVPLIITPEDVDVALGELWSEDVSPVLDALLLAGCPRDRLEGEAAALVDVLAEYFGPGEPGRLRRWWARTRLAWWGALRRVRLRPAARPAGTGAPVLLLADLWLRMLYGGVRRDRVPVILRGAVRAAGVERQLARLVEGEEEPGARGGRWDR